MIIRGQPHCDECKQRLEKLTNTECERDAEEHMIYHGWTNWKTAHKHYCFSCKSAISEEFDCLPLHLFPYETYLAKRHIQWLEEAIFNGLQSLLTRWLHV